MLGAKQRGDRIPAPGKIGHAELELGDSVIMLADGRRLRRAVTEDRGRHAGDDPCVRRGRGRGLPGGHGGGRHFQQDLEDQFYGDRMGQFEDPFGHQWSVATHVEDVSPEEMEKRAAAAMGG